MIDIRIVCTHDAVSFAEMLMRLLAAEEHRVQLTYGRNCLNELEAAKSERGAVVLIWSYDAPSQHYMLEWSRGVDPSRLVEIARAPGAPRNERHAPIIDFTNWRGDRGARAWGALNDRLRAVARTMEPEKPPPRRAAIALGLVSAAAVTSAIFVRVNEAPPLSAPEAAGPTVAAATEREEAFGGPLVAVEPASMEDLTLHFRPIGASLAQLELTQSGDLSPPEQLAILELREPTLLERLGELNPLRFDRG